MFGNGAKKEERKQKAQEVFAGMYNLEGLNPSDLQAIREIVGSLRGAGLAQAGALLTGKTEDVAKISYLEAIFKTNLLVIKKLDDVARALQER